MSKLYYRGYEQQPVVRQTQTLADQMRKPDLIYRGVHHNGEHPVEPEVHDIQFYRGYRHA